MRSEKLHLLSRFYGDWTVGFRQSKRKSSSTLRELCVGTRFWGFRQTPKVRGFPPTRFYSWSNSHSNGMRCWSRERLFSSVSKFWD